jgi:hypothetical protein
MVFVGSVVMLSVWQNVRIYSAGLEANEIDDRIKGIDQENRLLELELERLRDPEYLHKKAEQYKLDIKPPEELAGG